MFISGVDFGLLRSYSEQIMKIRWSKEAQKIMSRPEGREALMNAVFGDRHGRKSEKVTVSLNDSETKGYRVVPTGEASLKSR